ncbi:hypothetical protein EQG49_00455 [Periweissella cryptocerci]|uniref:Lipoprotein n=1 Tax=Periweissella cryptocerci TaxID=2506420 RepID=A0A4V1AIC5_9LACO|nr:hypothetical protein [Periweissella cryptocerci]QBO35025.1 hypothetical protein EQG49_00455 [Periweissella cryptocerci]
MKQFYEKTLTAFFGLLLLGVAGCTTSQQAAQQKSESSAKASRQKKAQALAKKRIPQAKPFKSEAADSAYAAGLSATAKKLTDDQQSTAIANVINLDYAKLVANNGVFMNDFYQCSGTEVIQVLAADKQSGAYLVATPQEQDQTTFRIIVKGDSHLKEGDIINVAGFIDENYAYVTDAKKTLVVPTIIADKSDIKNYGPQQDSE